MRSVTMGAFAVLALLFAASAAAIDLSRVLPTFELPRLRAEAPDKESPGGSSTPQAQPVVADTASASGPAGSSPAGSAPSAAVDASPASPRRERGWREMLPGLLHQP